MEKILGFSKKVVKEIIDKNSVVVDATCGNGNDTLFFAKTAAKKIYAFDVQELAIERTKELLKNNNVLNKCELILDNHSKVKNYVKEKVKAAVFNLGYLPNSSHKITTNYKTTIEAINNLLEILDIGGRIVVVIYWGHENGKIEKYELMKHFEKFNQKNVEVLKYQFINQKNNAPFLIVLEKIREF